MFQSGRPVTGALFRFFVVRRFVDCFVVLENAVDLESGSVERASNIFDTDRGIVANDDRVCNNRDVDVLERRS